MRKFRLIAKSNDCGNGTACTNISSCDPSGGGGGVNNTCGGGGGC